MCGKKILKVYFFFLYLLFADSLKLDSLLESSKSPRFSYFNHEDLDKKHNDSVPASAANTPHASSTAEDCKFNDPNNASAVLERVLQELELIRQVKEGNGIPEGNFMEKQF